MDKFQSRNLQFTIHNKKQQQTEPVHLFILQTYKQQTTNKEQQKNINQTSTGVSFIIVSHYKFQP